MTLLARIREQVRDHYNKSGKRARFEELECFLPGSREKKPYREIAVRLGVSEGVLRLELHRLKAAYRQFLRAEVAQTLTTSSEIDEELRHLMAVLQD